MFRVTQLVGFARSSAGSGPPPGGPCFWNSADKSANITLSGGDLIATATTGTPIVRGTTAKSSGKWYFEVTVGATATSSRVGVARSSAGLDTALGDDADGWGYAAAAEKVNNGSGVAYGATYAPTDVISIALDMDSGKIWWAKNGTWQASGDPAAGTNEAFSNVTGSIYPAWGSTNGLFGPSCTANFGATAFAYSPPVGFSAWGS